MSDLEVRAVAPTGESLQDFIEVEMASLDHPIIVRLESLLDLCIHNLSQESAILEYLAIPVNHRLVLALNSLHDAVSQVLIVVRQQSRCLLRLHRESPAQSIKDELERALSVNRLLGRIHLHDINSVLYFNRRLRHQDLGVLFSEILQNFVFS